MQASQFQLPRARMRAQRDKRALDLAHARHEHQHIAGHFLGQTNGAGGGQLAQVLASLRWRVLHRYRMRAPLHMQALGTQRIGQSLGIQRGAHHHQLQVGAPRILQTPHRGHRQIGLQTALVELVHHHRRNTRQHGLLQQHAKEHALGQEADAHRVAPRRVEARAPTHRLARSRANFLGHAPCHQSRGKPTRLQHQHLALQAGFKQQLWNLRGLARTRLRRQHHAIAARQRCGEFGCPTTHRQARSRRAAHRVTMRVRTSSRKRVICPCSRGLLEGSTSPCHRSRNPVTPRSLMVPLPAKRSRRF